MATIHTLIKGAIRERIGKRGVSYQISLDAENGRQGKRITETFKTYADAEKRLAALENGGRPTSTATVEFPRKLIVNAVPRAAAAVLTRLLPSNTLARSRSGRCTN